jgi:glycine/D-amino acid oxidase-like deaminating enzyme
VAVPSRNSSPHPLHAYPISSQVTYRVAGGGIIGCTTAYYLTRHPKFNPALHTITLLEAAPSTAAGASGKAGGLLALWAYPSCLVPLSYRLHAELAAEHNGTQKWGYRRLGCGSFGAIVSKSHIDQLQKSKVEGEGKAWEKLPKQNGAAKELLEEGSLPADLDWVDRDLVTSYAEMGSPGRTETSQVHPYHFTTSIGELAQRGGAVIKTKAKVTKISASKDGVEGVEYLDRETNETREVKDVTDIVIAAGPWTGRVLPRAKVEGLRAHSVVYEADVSPYAVFTDIELPADFVPEHRAKMGQRRRHKGRVDPEIYARPFGEVYACGEFIFVHSAHDTHTRRSGLTSLPPSPFAGEPDTTIPLPDTADQVQFDEAQCDDITAYIATISPVLGSAPIKAKQACYLPRHIRFGQESGPLIGKTTVPGLLVAAGHTCWGIQNGPGTGKLMREFVFDGAAKSADVEQLDPRKFKV